MKIYIVCPENPPCGSNKYSVPGEYYIAVSENGELLNSHVFSTKNWAEHDLLFSGEPTLYSILKEQYDEIEVIFLGEDDMTYERLIELNKEYRNKEAESMMPEEAMMENDKQKMEKIKTPFAKMIVGGNREKPCFSILYFDPADKDFHIGYSSYYLDYVFNWLNEEFEIVEDGNFDLSALRPVSREQVEKVFPGCDFCKIELDDYPYIVAHGEYSSSDTCYEPSFCPICGKPFTNEAVDMVMGRLEAMHEG